MSAIRLPIPAFSSMTYVPGRIDVAGVTWYIETNGNTLVAREMSERDDAPDLAPNLAKLTAWLFGEPIPVDAMESMADALSAFVGPPAVETKEECEECDGSGQIKHEYSCDLCETDNEECPECDGAGTVSNALVIVTVDVATVPVDANLVACALAVARASGPCRMWRMTTAKALCVAGDTWRFVVMQRIDDPVRVFGAASTETGT